MRALQEIRGMDENMAARHVQRWQETFGANKGKK
jgi:hypothetical protein